MSIEQSFIDNAITEMSEGSSRDAQIAKIVQEANAPQAANRIALTYVQLSNERKQNRIDAVAAGTPQIEMDIKPEHLLSFVQKVMNKCCWNARRIVNSSLDEDFANGLDFSQPIAEQKANLESSSMKLVETTLDDDFRTMTELHSWLCGRMNYMQDLDPLFLFAQKEKDEETEEWVATHELLEWREVFNALEEIALTLAENNDKEVAEYAANHEFGAAAA